MFAIAGIRTAAHDGRRSRSAESSAGHRAQAACRRVGRRSAPRREWISRLRCTASAHWVHFVARRGASDGFRSAEPVAGCCRSRGSAPAGCQGRSGRIRFAHGLAGPHRVRAGRIRHAGVPRSRGHPAGSSGGAPRASPSAETAEKLAGVARPSRSRPSRSEPSRSEPSRSRDHPGHRIIKVTGSSRSRSRPNVRPQE